MRPRPAARGSRVPPRPASPAPRARPQPAGPAPPARPRRASPDPRARPRRAGPAPRARPRRASPDPRARPRRAARLLGRGLGRRRRLGLARRRGPARLLRGARERVAGAAARQVLLDHRALLDERAEQRVEHGLLDPGGGRELGGAGTGPLLEHREHGGPVGAAGGARLRRGRPPARAARRSRGGLGSGLAQRGECRLQAGGLFHGGAPGLEASVDLGTDTVEQFGHRRSPLGVPDEASGGAGRPGRRCRNLLG